MVSILLFVIACIFRWIVFSFAWVSMWKSFYAPFCCCFVQNSSIKVFILQISHPNLLQFNFSIALSIIFWWVETVFYTALYCAMKKPKNFISRSLMRILLMNQSILSPDPFCTIDLSVDICFFIFVMFFWWSEDIFDDHTPTLERFWQSSLNLFSFTFWFHV